MKDSLFFNALLKRYVI